MLCKTTEPALEPKEPAPHFMQLIATGPIELERCFLVFIDFYYFFPGNTSWQNYSTQGFFCLFVFFFPVIQADDLWVLALFGRNFIVLVLKNIKTYEFQSLTGFWL